MSFLLSLCVWIKSMLSYDISPVYWQTSFVHNLYYANMLINASLTLDISICILSLTETNKSSSEIEFNRVWKYWIFQRYLIFIWSPMLIIISCWNGYSSTQFFVFQSILRLSSCILFIEIISIVFPVQLYIYTKSAFFCISLFQLKILSITVNHTI